ncbi:MAG: cyclase family protein [Candidatus Bathyarchaeia archaeon]
MIEKIVEALEGCEMIDLSEEVQPNILKVNGRYLRGNQTRKFYLQQFINADDGTYMHFIESESHIGTHVEGPSHLRDDLKSLIEIPLEKFIGEAVVLKFEAETLIKPEHLNKVRENDIVLLWSAGGAYITPKAAEYLVNKRIKMLGIQGIKLEDPKVGRKLITHKLLLENDIPIIEGLTNLDKIRHERIFFIGLPLRISCLDSSWIRAIALEPKI